MAIKKEKWMFIFNSLAVDFFEFSSSDIKTKRTHTLSALTNQVPIIAHIIAFSFLITSCSFFRNRQENNEAVKIESYDLQIQPDDEIVEPKREITREIDLEIDSQVNIENIELKQARLWSRIDEIEGKLMKQSEKIKLLEINLRMGSGGINSKNDNKAQLSKNTEIHPNVQFLSPVEESPRRSYPINKHLKAKHSNSLVQKVNKGSSKKFLENRDRMQIVYSNRMQAARQLFQEGRYGKAYLDFSKLDREFDAQISGGATKYWIGRCWFKLKEYRLAEQYLNQFIRSFHASPWQASAKFYLARSQLGMGMREKGIKQLQSLIKDHPNQGSSEAAKQLLANLKHTL